MPNLGRQFSPHLFYRRSVSRSHEALTSAQAKIRDVRQVEELKPPFAVGYYSSLWPSFIILMTCRKGPEPSLQLPPSSFLSLPPRCSLHTDRHGASVQCPLTR